MRTIIYKLNIMKMAKIRFETSWGKESQREIDLDQYLVIKRTKRQSLIFKSAEKNNLNIIEIVYGYYYPDDQVITSISDILMVSYEAFELAQFFYITFSDRDWETIAINNFNYI